MPYDAGDKILLDELFKCEETCWEINQIHPSRREEKKALYKKLFARIGDNFRIVGPFFCDYGYNIEIGDHFFANTNCVILDEAKVTFGDHVFIAPNCSFYTAGHPLDAELRNKGVGFAKPIRVGNNVWIGGDVTVLPGVTIGDNVTIGAGSVVTRDIPDNVLAVGNPCRVVKKLR